MRTARAAAATAVVVALSALNGCGTSYDDLPDIGAVTVAEQTGEQTAEQTVGTTVQQTGRRSVERVQKPQRVEPAVVIKALPEPVEPEVPVLVPGPTLYGPGAEGPEVREIQARLRQIAWFYGDVTDFYGDQTEDAIAGFQAKRGFPVTGAVDQRTLDRLVEMSYEPTADELANVEPEPVEVESGAPLDPRCLTGSVLCVDKSSSSLRWVVDGEVELTVDARFGGDGYFTREGQFSVFSKSRDHVSSLYETSMPFAMFFSGGQAVHYSPDFAANGYNGASHGCVNIRDYDSIAWLYDQVDIGDRVVVYWS